MNRLLTDQELSGISGPDSPYIPDSGSGIGAYTSSLELIISNTLAVLTVIGAIMFSIFFLIGGLTWITGGGDQGKVDDAKKKMTGAAIGLIIIGLSYSIAYIVSKVVGIDILYPGKTIQGLF